jgi:serine beta-lactamase-like protein LACTB, mitochondrial
VSKRRKDILLAMIAIPISLLLTFIAGLHLYMTRTATPLHPEPERVPSTPKREPSTEWAGAVERGRVVMRAGLSEQNLPGLSVAVGVRGETVWAEGFGWADLDKRVAVAPDMRFRIGTASVALTSAAAGLLLEEDRLKLDDEIQTYVPEFPYREWPVTLRQLLGDTSGVPNDGGDEGPLFTKRCERPADAFQFLSGYERELLFEPGTKYHYSSYGWIAVSAAIEAAAGEPLPAFMRKQIFEGLEMNDTVPDSETRTMPDQVASYFPRYAANPRYGPDLIREIGFSCYSGSSVFVSTPADLVRFGMAIDSGKLLQPATVQLLHTPQRLASGETTGHGLGWDLEAVTLGGEEMEVIGHDGRVLGGTVASLILR